MGRGRPANALIEDAQFRKAVFAGATSEQIKEALCLTVTDRSIRRFMARVRESAGLGKPELISEVTEPKPLTPKQAHRQAIMASIVNPPVDAEPPNAEIAALRRDIEQLREQLTWAQRADSAQRTGGLVTINHSDDHHGDRAHMLAVHQTLEDKALIVLKQYQPDRIVMLSNGDKIAGRGVYKEQHCDSVLPMTDQQRKVAAVKVYRFDKRIKEQHRDVPVKWVFTHGNHDINQGERITPDLVTCLRALGVDATYHGDQALLNLADKGDYWVYAEHGTGHSNISPTSPRFLDAMKDRIIILGRKFYGERRVRRILHGHTHWMNLSMERLLDVFFDTTGGCQRNERVMLGRNSRPVGWIAYVSPRGYDGILDPIPIQPSLETLEQELSDPYLLSRNMTDCAACLVEYSAIARERGIEADMVVPEGR